MSDLDRIRWQCRRGMKELDVMLTRYIEAEYEQLNVSQRQQFQQVLNLQDPDLYHYLMGNRIATDPNVAGFIHRIRTVSGV